MVGQHELDGGDGRLYLVDPKLYIAAIGGRVITQGRCLLGGKLGEATGHIVSDLTFQKRRLGDEGGMHAGLAQLLGKVVQFVIEGGFAAVVQKAGAQRDEQ